MNSPNAQNAQNALYLLGFSPHHGQQPVTVPPLLTQLRIEYRVAAGIAVWYRAVPRSEFEGPLGQQNLQDLNWLTPRVLAHESVVSKLSETYPFYPANFGCLFSGIDVLTEYVVANQSTLKQFFDRAVGRQEWGVKFTADLDLATQEATARQLKDQVTRLGGAAYLRLKQAQRTMRGPVLADLQRTVDERIEQLKKRFVEVVIRPKRSLAQPDREALLANVALWLEPEAARAVRDSCEQWNTEHTSLRAIISGPWPAYSFCPALIASHEQRHAA
jgi:hypothetical protein